jgi:hypothetical protein
MIRYEQQDVDAHLAKMAGKAAKAPAISEAKFQAQVMKIAAQLGWRFYHTHDSIGSQAGFPDLVFVRSGRLFFAEIKSEKGKLRKEQKEWLELINKSGILCTVWRPSMMEEVWEILK